MPRVVRIFLTASFPVLLALILTRERLSSSAVFYQSWVGTAEWAVFIAGAASVVLGMVWARRKGLTIDEALRLLLGPTLASPRWNEAAVSRLLAPASGRVRSPDPDAPHDYLRAIREIIPLIDVSRRDMGSRAADAAECVLRVISVFDVELKTLSHDAGQVEEHRLASQLDSLDSAGTAESGERAELRALVRHQLDLVHRMQGRREIVLAERARLMDMLRALWTLVRAAGDNSPGQEPGVVDRLHALCSEIQLQLEPAGLPA